MKKIKDRLKDLKAKIRLLPIDLKCLFWFSAPLFFLCILSEIFMNEQVYEKILPYTGWSPGFGYGILALITIQNTSLKTNDSNLANFISIRKKVVYVLGIYLIKGIYDWFKKAPEFYIETNPYLKYDPLQPVYAIFLPMFWILIIGWSLMMVFFRKKSDDSSETHVRNS